MSSKKNIVITGATSPIGVALIEVWRKYTANITVIVREKSEKMKRLEGFSDIKVIECDLSAIETLNDEQISCDIFYHIAWEGTGRKKREDCVCQQKNIEYTLRMVEMAHGWGAKVFIGTGSQAEYGRVEGLINEETLCNPETPYGIAKYAAGKFSENLCRKYNMKFKWARVFSAYGKYDNPNTLIMLLISKLLKGESMSLTPCEQIWDYINYHDVGYALYLLGIKGEDGIYCIANGNSNQLLEYVNIIHEHINKNIRLGIGENDYSKNQVMNLRVDIKKLKEETGFKSKICFTDGIEDLIQWYKNEKHNIENR